jgi:hypothetical protein
MVDIISSLSKRKTSKNPNVVKTHANYNYSALPKIKNKANLDSMVTSLSRGNLVRLVTRHIGHVISTSEKLVTITLKSCRLDDEIPREYHVISMSILTWKSCHLMT